MDYEQEIQDRKDRLTSLTSSMTTQMNVLGDMEVRNLKLEIRQIKAEIEWLEDAIARRNARAERTRNVERKR